MVRNVVFMGTPDFAVGTLRALIESEKYQVQAVFSQPDKPKGRSGALQMTPVKALAVSAGIPVYQPDRIRDPKWLEVLRQLCPDVIVVVAFGQIIPAPVLHLPQFGCINVHASLLPAYRGAAPIQWAIINGESRTGVTTMRMDEGLDTGDMILQEAVPVERDETGGSLFEKLSLVGARLLIRTLEALDEGTAHFEKQPEKSPTAYAAMLTKKDGRIDFCTDAHRIECRIRGLNPWPGTWTMYHGKVLKIWKAEAADITVLTEISASLPAVQNDSASGEKGGGTLGMDCPANPGTVCAVTKNALYIQTGSGVLSVLEVQPEGKKRMSIDAFLRGYPVKKGEQF